MWKKYFAIVLCLLLVACSGGGSNNNNNNNKRSVGLERLRLKDVPIRSYRLAVQHVVAWEEEKFADVNFKDTVSPFYRPDIEGVAYYEFMLEPEGFVLISSGEHDYPIAQARDSGPTISEQLEAQAEEEGKEVNKIYKMDSLAYYAENSEGELVATLGNLLFKIEGLEAWPSEETEPTETIVTINEVPDEEDPEETDFEIEQTGPGKTNGRFGNWGRYVDLKEGYANYYAPLINNLKEAASASWETERFISEYGEGLVIGQRYPLPLLFSGAELSLFQGPDEVAIVDSFFIKINEDGNSLILEAQEVPDNINEAIKLEIQYENGLSESLSFGVVPSELSNADLVTQNHTHWSSWRIYLAGSHSDQRIYKQFDISPGCPSGCGATAWAMLFGWADHQADGNNSYWQPRWGLYRENGGKRPAKDAVAPRSQDSSIETITKEIRGYIGSYCFAGSGPTIPWDMASVWRYMIGRSGTSVKVGHNGLWGGHRDDHRDRAIASIKNRQTPAIIGTGWLAHYPLAYGYAERYRWVQSFWGNWDKRYEREFLINQGWGYYRRLSNERAVFWEWVPAGTWFVGEIYP